MYILFIIIFQIYTSIITLYTYLTLRLHTIHDLLLKRSDFYIHLHPLIGSSSLSFDVHDSPVAAKIYNIISLADFFV